MSGLVRKNVDEARQTSLIFLSSLACDKTYFVGDLRVQARRRFVQENNCVFVWIE